MSASAGKDPGAVLPPMFSDLIRLAWLLLLGGRWLLGYPLLYARVITLDQLVDLDTHILYRLYLLLLAVTIVVGALQVMRNRRSAPKPIPFTEAEDGGRSPDEQAITGSEVATASRSASSIEETPMMLNPTSSHDSQETRTP